MKKNNIVSLVAAVLTAVLVTVGNAQPSSNWIPSVTFRSVLTSKYLAFGHGFVIYDKPAVQTDLYAGFACGLYLDFWNSAPFEGYNKNPGTEQDYGFGWTGKLSKFGIKGATGDLILDIGSSYFDEPNLGTFGPGDVVYSHFRMTKELKWLNISGCYENYTALPRSGFRGGNLLSLGFTKSKPFFNDLLTISTALASAYDFGSFGLDNGFFLRGSAELDWKITKRLTLILPQLNYYAPLTTDDSRSLDKMISGGLSFQF